MARTNSTACARRPGRPKNDQKRGAILDAAGELFLSEGWAGTSMDAIAKAASVSKQTVYSHFHSKEALFRACVLDKVEEYRLASPDTDLDLHTTLVDYGKRFLLLLNDDVVIRMYRLILGHVESFPNLVRSFVELGPMTVRTAVMDVLRSHSATELSDEQAAYLADRFLCLLREPYLMQRLTGERQAMSEEEISQQAEQASEDFLVLMNSR